MKANYVYKGDCLELMEEIPDESIDLIFADPPYNIGIEYDLYRDNLSYEEYYKWSEKWIRESYRILKRNGSIYIAIGDEFASEINIILKKTGFYFRNWIIWFYTFGQHQKKKYCRSHAHIHYFTKSKNDFTFNADNIRVKSARQLVYKDKRANPNGRIPDDTWEIEENIWKVSRVCGTFKERIENHPCQMPEKILERIVKASSNEDDIVFDPFGGTGTTAFIAKKYKRKYITSEISENYYQVILKRLEGEYQKNASKTKSNHNIEKFFVETKE